MPPPQYVEVPVYDDQYRMAAGPRHTARPSPPPSPMQHRLAKLDVFKGEIGEKLDDFIHQVEEFATFHAWDLVETCRQARTHLRGVALAYIRRTLLPPRHWSKLKTLLTPRFQPRDLTAANKAQFRTRKRQRSEDIPTYVDALQKLTDMAWPLLDPIARDEMVDNQFLNGLDSHELRVQVAATGIRRIKDLMRVARSLEALENQETGHGRQRRGSTQTQFSEEEGLRQKQRALLSKFWPSWGSNLDRAGTKKNVLQLQGHKASEVWTGRHLQLLQRVPPRAKVPRKLWSVIGDAHRQQIKANRGTERGHHSSTSAMDMGTSWGTAREGISTPWGLMAYP